MGGPDTLRHERSEGAATLVRLYVGESTAILQLNDPEHFNTFSPGLGEAMRRAVVYRLVGAPSRLPLHVITVNGDWSGPPADEGGVVFD
mgnify:CR=1 FL=1